jgi:hypothetical protein
MTGVPLLPAHDAPLNATEPPLDIARVEMRVGGGKPLDQTGFGHAFDLRIPTLLQRAPQ